MPKVGKYELPDGLYYNTGHMWARLEGDSFIVGLNDFAQQLAGEVSFVELPMDGDEVSQDEVIGTIETGKWVQKISAPVSGTITEVNLELEDEPALINTDPYGNGWLLKLELSNPAELDALMDSHEYDEFVTKLEEDSV